MKSNVGIVVMVFMFATLLSLSIDSMGLTADINIPTFTIPEFPTMSASGSGLGAIASALQSIIGLINVAITLIATLILLVTFQLPIPVVANMIFIAPLGVAVVWIIVTQLTLGD